MADNDFITLAKINYWCREKCFRHMQNAASEGLKKFGNDPILKFFYGYSLILEDRVQEGMRELEPLKDVADVNLCTILALVYAHKKSKTVDREAIRELDTKLKEERKQAGEKALYFAGLFLFHNARFDKAPDYVDRMLKLAPHSATGLALKGWLELQGASEAFSKKASRYFDEVLGQDGMKDIDATLGKARFLESRRNFSGALQLVNELIVSCPNFLPGLIEKMRLLLALKDWEQSLDVANRILSTDRSCLQAQQYQIMYLLCCDGKAAEAAEKMADLVEEMDRVEPRNPTLCDNYARLFSRICGRANPVLQQTYFLAERAAGQNTGDATYVTELGHQLLLLGRQREAIKCFRNAMKMDDTSVTALTGTIHCQLLEGNLEDAAQQLEFINEIQQSIGRSAEFCYLSALLANKRHETSEKVIELLNEAVDIHFNALKGLQLGEAYFVNLDPDFLILIIHEYMTHAPQQPQTRTGQPTHPVLASCIKVLEPLTKLMPGLLEALYFMAKVKFLTGDVDAAQGILQHCLERDASYADAHILMAQIYLHQGNFKSANQSLEVGLSYNFEVREHPLYHLIRARIFKKQGDLQETAKTLQIAMTLPGVKNAGDGQRMGKKTKVADINVSDRVSVFLELAEAHRLLNETHEAAKVMQDAINEFSQTGEEVRIVIANSDLALDRGDVDGAIGMLRNVTPEQTYFVEARQKMAAIYLNQRKDKRLYAGCYRELVDKQPSPRTYLLLGDAYMNIQEPERAIDVYETALKKNTRDSALASKIGQALVKTHSYAKAISYYEAALKSGGQSFLRHDLAELLMKLRQYDKAEKFLKAALDEDSNDLSVMMDQTSYMMLLSKVYERQDRNQDSILYLTKARELQIRVLKRAQLEQPDSLPAQKQQATSISRAMAENAMQQREIEKAIMYYKEAASYSNYDGKTSLELAKLYLQTEDLDSCQNQCMSLLKNDQETDAATVMLADLMFRKNDYDQAMFHFQQLLERRPDHYEALARLIDLMRRAGKMDEMAHFMEKAEASHNTIDAGLHFCKGLYEWYTGNPNSALKHFNKARKDTTWGQQAVYNMIEICLNPDNDTIGGEVFEAVDQESGLSSEKADSELLALHTAEKLMRELKPKTMDTRAKILKNMMLVATKRKTEVEAALAAFMDIAQAEREHVGALYGMAAAYMVLKQVPRARNQLKRVAKNSWNMQDAEDLEKSWLLLADIYIQAAKYDMATEMLKRCLQYNKTCGKAYEYMGYIMEKEQSYQDAALNYEMAWKFSKQNNPSIGYKLAFNYMKARRFVDAIDVSLHVIKNHPNYPRIRKDILEKSRSSIRV